MSSEIFFGNNFIAHFVNVLILMTWQNSSLGICICIGQLHLHSSATDIFHCTGRILNTSCWPQLKKYPTSLCIFKWHCNFYTNSGILQDNKFHKCMLLHNDKARVHVLGKVKKREVGKVKATGERDWKKNYKGKKFIARIQCHIQAITNSLGYCCHKKFTEGSHKI